ncbi:peptidylprolyl isomerase [Inediibacterium massiliense]|uniref:peptidylprolyl isomerase n=1 Tax=Inediibacterium massiliense TaxID=1658111 RepID=UPI0006B64939|nr:peptidylprolyl isomerase [Inediibacterium massiliense]
MNKQVLATVNGCEITKEDLELVVQHAPAEQKMQLNTLAGKKYLLNEMITQQMLYLDAKKKGLDQDEEFLKELKAVGENLLKQYAVRKLLDTVVVDEAEVKEYYEKNPEQFVKGPCVHAKHILVKEEEQAQNILKEIKAGKKFEDAASEYSECPSKANGGDLGEFEKGKMVPEFEKVAFELEIGKVSEPVKTQFGYHLILVEDKKDKKEIPFEEVKNTIKDYMLRMKQNDTYKSYADGLRDQYEITTHEDLLK